MNKKVLALGYIPKGKGGRQVSGLATGLFDLHNAVNELGAGVQVFIAATDIFDERKEIDSTIVLGWSKIKIIFHALKRFYRIPFFIISAYSLMKYKPIASFLREFSKLLFLDYAIDIVQPNYIHLHGCFYALYSNMIWHKGIPVVLRVHGINGFDSTITYYDIYKKIEKAIIALPFKEVTFVTSSICEEWKNKIGSFSCPMTPIINGFNSKVFYPSQDACEKKYDLITIAGLQERKGQIRVMEAMKKCNEAGKKYSYVIVGDDSKEYGKVLKEYAKSNDLNVKFTGYLTQKEANSYLWASKYFIQPSATEGFGKVYIESIGAGVPVILPKHLPIVQDKGILNDYNALLTEDESAESIYNLLVSLGDYNYDRFKLANTVNHLSWSNIASQYVKLYN